MLACDPLLAIRVSAVLKASTPSLPVGPGGPLSPLRGARTRFARTIATDGGHLDSGTSAEPDDSAGSASDYPIVIQVADDEWLIVGTDDVTQVVVDDEHAIVERDHGWVGAWLDAASLQHLASRHIEWVLPAERPALAQGNVAGVPAKLHLPADSDGALLICLAAFAHELEERVG